MKVWLSLVIAASLLHSFKVSSLPIPDAAIVLNFYDDEGNSIGNLLDEDSSTLTDSAVAAQNEVDDLIDHFADAIAQAFMNDTDNSIHLDYNTGDDGIVNWYEIAQNAWDNLSDTEDNWWENQSENIELIEKDHISTEETTNGNNSNDQDRQNESSEVNAENNSE